jgi:hypothetical protein
MNTSLLASYDSSAESYTNREGDEGVYKAKARMTFPSQLILDRVLKRYPGRQNVVHFAQISGFCNYDMKQNTEG